MCRPAGPPPPPIPKSMFMPTKPIKTYILVPTSMDRVELWYTLGNEPEMKPVMASDLLKEFVKINLSKE